MIKSKKDFKNMIISTERLYIRQIQEDDVKYIYKLALESLDEKLRKDEAFVDINCNFLWDELTKDNVYTVLVFLKESNEFVGQIHIRNLDKQVPEIGLRLLEMHCNKSYAYEALKPFCNWFFHTYVVSTIRVRIKNNNIASIKLFEKLGALFQEIVQYVDDDFDEEILKLFTEEELNRLNETKSMREYILKLPIQ